MKRSKIKRSKRLTTDAKSIREFNRRAREKAVERADAERERAIERAREARAQQQRSSSLERQQEQATVERINAASPTYQPPVSFRGPLLRGHACFSCLRHDRRRPARQWHHWLGQSQIKAYVRSLRIRDDVEQRALLRRLLHDRRNISPVCADCHAASDPTQGADGNWTADCVPKSAHEFAAELGPEWAEKLRRTYPATGCSRSRT